MNRGKRQTVADGRLDISARAIVMIGVSSLFMVLLGTVMMGVGLAFNIGMGLLFAVLIAFILVMYGRGAGSGR